MVDKTKKDLWVEMSIREIWTQTNFAKIAYSHINQKAMAKNDLIFSSIHSFLSHCAMISKMLSATDSNKKTIGDIIGVKNTSLIHKRKFRNSLEHYDKELKKWIDKFPINVAIGTYNIGPKSAIQCSNIILVSHYDPATKIFTFVNNDFNLEKLFIEAKKVKGNADKWVIRMEQGAITPPFI